MCSSYQATTAFSSREPMFWLQGCLKNMKDLLPHNMQKFLHQPAIIDHKLKIEFRLRQMFAKYIMSSLLSEFDSLYYPAGRKNSLVEKYFCHGGMEAG